MSIILNDEIINILIEADKNREYEKFEMIIEISSMFNKDEINNIATYLSNASKQVLWTMFGCKELRQFVGQSRIKSSLRHMMDACMNDDEAIMKNNIVMFINVCRTLLGLNKL